MNEVKAPQPDEADSKGPPVSTAEFVVLHTEKKTEAHYGVAKKVKTTRYISDIVRINQYQKSHNEIKIYCPGCDKDAKVAYKSLDRMVDFTRGNVITTLIFGVIFIAMVIHGFSQASEGWLFSGLFLSLIYFVIVFSMLNDTLSGDRLRLSAKAGPIHTMISVEKARELMKNSR